MERCFFATNWPVDKVFSTYDALIDAYTELISGFSRDEQVALFSRDRGGLIPDLMELGVHLITACRRKPKPCNPTRCHDLAERLRGIRYPGGWP